MTVRKPFWFVLGVLLGGSIGLIFYPEQEVNVRNILFRLVVLAGLLLVIGFCWAFLSVRGIRITRYARVLRQQVGQVFEERFEITNRLPVVRLWLEVLDESTLPGKSSSRVLSWIGANQKRSYLSITQLHQRGLYSLGPTTMLSGDPFGIYLFRRKINATQSLLVLPYTVNLRTFPSPPGVLSGGRAIRRKTLEVSPQSAGVREYVEGDSLSRIHWPSTAKKDKLMVKEFEQDPQADVWIFIDAQEAVHIRKEEIRLPAKTESTSAWWKSFEVKLPADTFEYATSIAGSVSAYFIKQGKAVGFACAGQVTTVLPAERGERQLNKILDTLAFLQPRGSLPVLGLIESQSSMLPRGSTVVLITPSLSVSVDLSVQHLMTRRLKPVVLFIDANSFLGKEEQHSAVDRFIGGGVPTISIKYQADLVETLSQSY